MRFRAGGFFYLRPEWDHAWRDFYSIDHYFRVDYGAPHWRHAAQTETR
jgi:hypothetical protein